MLKHPEGHFHLADSLAPRDALEASEFYNDWMRPQDLDNGFGASVLKFGRHFMFYSLLHTKRAKTGERDLELLRLLVPHMQRSARLYGHFLGLQEKIDSTTAALDRLAIGALLCDRTGRVLVMNKAAERMIMLGDGLNLIAGHLKPAHKTESDTMAKLIAGATQMDEGGLESCGGALTISRPSGRRSFGVIVAPYQGNPPPSLCVRLAPATRVAIFIADPDARNEPPQQVIARLFGLTVAEAHLASKVAQGRPLPEISEELGITRETARSRLKTIFAKTDTHSQASLAKLILSGPAGLLLGAGPETAEPL